MEPSSDRSWFERSRLASALCLLLLVLVPTVLVGLHMDSYPELSPIDEQSHADYVIRGPGVLPVRSGDQWGEEVLRAEACRGIATGFVTPACDAPVLSPDQFELQGYNSAYIHPPTYYNITSVVSEGAIAIGLSDDRFGAARATGALWLSAGLLVAWWAGRRLGAPRVPLLGALLLLAGAPGVVFTSSTVTPDAANMLVGAVVTGAVVVADRGLGRWAVLLLLVAGVVATGVKLQNIIVLLPAVLFLLLRALDRLSAVPRGRRLEALARERAVAAAALLAVPALVVATLWTIIWNRAATVPPMDLPIAGIVDGDPLGLAYLAFGAYFPPTLLYVPPVLTRLPVLAWSQVTDWIIIGCLVATVLFGRAAGPCGPTSAALGRASLLAGVTAGPLLIVMSVISLGAAFPLPERYGATLLVPMVLVVAAVVGAGVRGLILLGIGAVTVILQVLGLTIG